MLSLRCCLTVPKDEAFPNEDCCQRSDRLGVFALSDGAAISYDSALWSKILSRTYCRHRSLDQAWLHDCIAAFNAKHDRDSLSWAQQAAFDRGSFASLLGLVIDRAAAEVRLCAAGDTAAFLCDGDRVLWSCPYSKPEEFDSNPTLVSTNFDLNSFDESGSLECRREIWSVTGLVSPILLCMTDALGKWFLESKNRGDNPVERLRSVASRASFKAFVLSERSSGRMKRDDSTLLGFW